MAIGHMVSPLIFGVSAAARAVGAHGAAWDRRADVKRTFLNNAMTRLRLTPQGAPYWAETLLVIALAITLGQLTWQLVPLPAAARAPAAASSTRTIATKLPSLESVAAMHLFGQSEMPAAHQADAPETSLNLTLRGLFAASRKELAFAIIVEGGSNERYFRIGDTVGGGATVREILEDRVILERAGRFETLRLPKERLELSAAHAPASSYALTPALSQKVEEIRKRVAANPQEVLQLATVIPVMENGSVKGYRVQPKQYQDIFSAAGLSPADVITSVNGIPVNDPAQLGALNKQFSSATELSLTVVRPDGSQDEVHVNLK